MSDTITTVNPTTGKPIKSYDYMTEDEAINAVEKCHDAFTKWKTWTLKERAKVIKQIGETLENHKDELAELMTTEMGKLLRDGREEVTLCKGICDYTAKNGQEVLKDEKRKLANGGKGIITYSPQGVIYGIQPWNFPIYQVMRYSIVNLMAGNGVILSHAENTTGSGLRLKEIYEEAGLPEDLFTVVIVKPEVSEKIVENDLVRGVTFTGSAATGKKIAAKAGEALKKTVLELGSNDAYIVLEDADIPEAIKTCTEGRLYNNGETCVAAKRFIVTEPVYDHFVSGFIDKMKNVKMGDPKDADTQLGPMAREDLRDKLHDQVQKSIDKGAKLEIGGGVPDRDGWFYPSTVLTNVQKGQPAYDEELFGPVASVIKVKDATEAMEVANDSRFGLGGGIFSKDENKAVELASKYFDTGMVFINCFGVAQVDMPFGGVKDSGYGREHGGFGIKEFVNIKAINILEN
jgi:succinate-semialdehyde dehydrogenase/glutarate-semialdehyde dehydrogenase